MSGSNIDASVQPDRWTMNGMDVDDRGIRDASPPGTGWWRRKKRRKTEGACMNRDELEGKAEALKGKVKQAAGNATNDPDLHDEGVADEVAGKTQDALGRGRRKVGEAVRDIGNAIKK
jgi:uncharacterized protein YjbJ (UPF0337 family)